MDLIIEDDFSMKIRVANYSTHVDPYDSQDEWSVSDQVLCEQREIYCFGFSDAFTDNIYVFIRFTTIYWTNEPTFFKHTANRRFDSMVIWEE